MLFRFIGLDAFLEIDTWKQFSKLPNLVSFVIITRPGYRPDRIGETITRNFMGYEFDPEHEVWSSPDSGGLFILQHMEPVAVSSTEIRARVKDGLSITDLVPQPVADYIRQQGLYV